MNTQNDSRTAGAPPGSLHPVVRLCVNCKHFNGARCIRNPSLKDGGPVDGWRSNAGLLREENWLMAILFNTCGRRGRWYEPNDPDQRPGELPKTL